MTEIRNIDVDCYDEEVDVTLRSFNCWFYIDIILNIKN